MKSLARLILTALLGPPGWVHAADAPREKSRPNIVTGLRLGWAMVELMVKTK